MHGPSVPVATGIHTVRTLVGQDVDEADDGESAEQHVS